MKFLGFFKIYTDIFLEYSPFSIQIKAKAFLWHQIRCIMGILFLIGQEKEEPIIIDDLLNIEQNPRYFLKNVYTVYYYLFILNVFRKPDYGMASEIPLNLFSCEYEHLSWNYEMETLKKVIDKLNSIWTIMAIK